MLPVYCVLAVAIAIWSAGFPAISAAVRVYTPLEMAAFRMVVGGSLILLLCGLLRQRMWPPRDQLLPSILCGLIGIAAYNILLGYGQQYITAAESSLLVAITPVFTVLASVVILGERIGWKTGGGIALSFSGVLVMAWAHEAGAGVDWGILLAVLAAATQALLTIVQKHMLTHASPLEVTSWCTLWAMAAMLPLGYTVFPKALAAPEDEATLALVYLAVFSLVVGYVAWAYVLKHMSASRAASFLYVVPVGSGAVGYLWLGEIPDDAAFAGGALALAGVAVVNYRRARKAHSPAPSAER